MRAKLIAAESTSASNPFELFAYIPAPVAALLATLVVLVYIISEVRGWTNGPLAKRVTKAQEKAEEEQKKVDSKWVERDRRYEELEEATSTLREEMARLKEQLNVFVRLSGEQNALIIEHSNWDREIQAEVVRLGGRVSPPPQLFVFTPSAADSGILPA